jgi:hypothetical protein
MGNGVNMVLRSGETERIAHGYAGVREVNDFEALAVLLRYPSLSR